MAVRPPQVKAAMERPLRFFPSPACGGGREGASGRAARHGLVAGRPSPNPSRKREGR